MAKTTACLLYVLIGCAVGLTYILESIAAKINAIGAGSGQVTTPPPPPSEILMATIVSNEDTIDRSAIIVVQQEYMDLRGEGLLGKQSSTLLVASSSVDRTAKAVATE